MLPTGMPKQGGWTWEKILQEDPHHVHLQKDGYTCLMPIADNRFLIAYCDQAHVDAKGRIRKAAKVRTVTVDSR
ncbi:MAG: hypothetical protein HY360_23355 [Verrucomicrobia bacterium]|nr:hypothetical protein [Verrucomicrobiota bacterium]